MTSPSSFEALLAPHLAKLYRLAYRWTGSMPDAEDLLQDLLLKLYERRSELGAITALDTWAARVLYHLFVDNARRYSRRRLVSVGSAEADRAAALDSQATVGSPGEPTFDITALARALDGLALEHRTVLLMHDAEGYKLEEIQSITGIPLGTVKSRLHRARARLRELLDQGDGTF